MKKNIAWILSVTIVSAVLATSVSAATSHTVVSGDTMWKIAARHQIGLSELQTANPQIPNPNLIYPGQILNIPDGDTRTLDYEQAVITLVNEIRAQYGLRTLTYNWELARVARYKSQDMKDNRYFSHTSPVYGTPFQMMKSFGIPYRSAAENIARGQKTPQAVVSAWMNSEGHRANILNPSYTQIGVGYVAEGNYWTQMFIGP